MTKGEAIKQVEDWLATLDNGLVTAETPLPPVEAIKRVLREAKANAKA